MFKCRLGIMSIEPNDVMSEHICDIVIDLTIKCTERASFFLAGFGLSSGNDLLSLGAGAIAAPASIEAGKRIGVYYDNKRTLKIGRAHV